jgi:hypothetical protein
MTSSEQLALELLSPDDKTFMLHAPQTDLGRFEMLAGFVRRYADQIERRRMTKRFWPSGTTDGGGYPSVSHKVTS